LLANLQILIIDEVSLVKSDMLYQLNLRLQEVKECKDNFGGVCVLLFGDLMQLRPVQAKWIFAVPRSPSFALSHAFSPLLHSSQILNLLGSQIGSQASSS
jgi:hypothetical protein